MSISDAKFTAGTIIPLANSAKKNWELGQVRLIASGTLNADGTLASSSPEAGSWQLSMRSIETSATFTSAFASQVFTLIAGDFIELSADGNNQGLEPLRPLKISTTSEVTASQPTEELLLVHVAADPAAVRATVRIVELSKKRDQYLFDGQLGFLIQGSATLMLGEEQHPLALRDTVAGGDEGEPRISGRGFMAVVSFDQP